MDSEKHLFLHFFLLILQFSFCMSQYSINTNQSIKDGDLLFSKGNKFVLGFFSPGSSSYRYLGIWHHKIAEQTALWVANRNDPISGSSGFLSINKHGNLVLFGNLDRKVPVWSTNVSIKVSDGCIAQLLDSGNLVLVQDRSKQIVWQSFDHPTNVLLPEMKSGLDRKTGFLRGQTSWRSADDPGDGEFSTRFSPNGSPQLFIYKGTEPYSRVGLQSRERLPSLYNRSFVSNEDEIYYFYSFLDEDPPIIKMILDHSGFFKILTWHESDSQWKEFWKYPQTVCDYYGRCGPNSICEPTFVSRFECSCLPGFEPKYPRDWLMRDGSSGCVRKRLDSSSVCKNGEGFVKMEVLFHPDTSASVWVDMSMSRAECEMECLLNCSCSAYAIIEFPGKGDRCFTWYGELLDTRFDRTEGYDLYVRVDAYELAEYKRKSNGSDDEKKKNILPILAKSVALLCFLLGLFVYLWLRKRAQKGTTKNQLWGSSNTTDLEFFKLSTITAATNNFCQAKKLGQGGFGSVYKGLLPNGQEVAVKRLSRSSGQGIEEFKNEAMVMENLQHRNLVKLLGCCIEDEEQILIYEFLPNKSLDSFIFDERRMLLDWQKRLDIIIGIARGILYLHQDSRLRVIHRDLKCSNILLDAEMNPKISDFGTAKIFESNQIQDRTRRVVGTYGYMSPEYVVFGEFSVKSDVFSFGIMLLEIVSGKKNNKFYQHNLHLTLIGYVWKLWREDKALEIVDSSLIDLCHPQEALKCVQIGLLCVQEDALDRPSMLAIIFMLSNETFIPSPKEPAFIFWESGRFPDIVVDVEDRGPCSINEMTITEIGSR